MAICYSLQVVISDPTDGELHLLKVDLATGVSSAHSVPQEIEMGHDGSVDTEDATTRDNDATDRSSLPAKLEYHNLPTLKVTKTTSIPTL